jgi:hypothetical protein
VRVLPPDAPTPQLKAPDTSDTGAVPVGRAVATMVKDPPMLEMELEGVADTVNVSP